MDLSLAVLGGLAAAMALDAAPDPTPAPISPQETPVSCDAFESEAAKAKCRRERNEVDPLTIDGAKRGDTEGPIEPELVLDEVVIQSMGVNTVGDLLKQLAPMLSSARGRSDEPPIILINGQRITGDMSSIPAEAILRAAPMREEEAIAHGYRPDQFVLNIVLKKGFKATTLTSEGVWPTAGGRASSDHLANLFQVQGEGRTLVNARYHRDSPLFETERGVVRTPLTGAPYDLNGAIVGAGGGEIDPALSALVGQTVTTAAVPASAAGGAPSLADFVPGAGRMVGEGLTAARTLMPRTEQAKIDGAYTRPLKGGMVATLAGDLSIDNSVSFRGLPGVMLTLPESSPFSPFAGDVSLYRYLDAPQSLKTTSDTNKVGAAFGLQGMKSRWRWNLDGNVDRSDSATRIGRGLDATALRTAVAAGQVNPFGPIPAGLLRYAPRDTADSVSTSAKVNMTLNGTLPGLPAGRMTAMLQAGFDSRRIDSQSVRSGVRVDRVLTRDRGSVSGNLNIPILDRKGSLAALGKLSLNANGQYERFSDLGGLVKVGGGVAWSPVKGFNVSADYGLEEGEPTPQQMNNPVQQTTGSLVYDYATGQTAFVTIISGGNPALRHDRRELLKLDVGYKPFETKDLRFTTTYTVARTDDFIANFPAASPELEAAFPTRFTRDALGALTSIDTRAVNFDHADSAELRSKVTYVRRWGGPKPGTGPKSLFVFLSDRWRLRDEVTIRDGMAPLDKLNGASLGQFRGTPRHEVNLYMTVGVPGYSFGTSVFWWSSTQVDGGARTGDLRFSMAPVVTLFGTLDLGAQKDLVKDRPWLKGTKLNLRIENAFNSYQRVRDENGATPESYQRALISAGSSRAVRLSLRKQF